MDKIKKLLEKISKKDRQRIDATIELIIAHKWDALDIKKLSGFNEWRARVGKYRIKFYFNDSRVKILDVQRRSDNTY